jgi:hypothetical protein
VREDWAELHSGDSRNLYSPNIVRVIKLWKIRWAGHVARVSEKIYTHRGLMGTPKETDRLEVLCVDEITLLKWLLNSMGRHGQLVIAGTRQKRVMDNAYVSAI